ncbi:hypothetical protein Tco_1169924, partial [Tanacetum coccineum]
MSSARIERIVTRRIANAIKAVAHMRQKSTWLTANWIKSYVREPR